MNMLNKAEMRQKLKQIRLEMSEKEVISQSHAIVGQLVQQIDWPHVKSLHVFEAIEQLNEVRLNAFIQFIRAEHPGISLYTSSKVDGRWQVVALKDHSPAEGVRVETVIVPMLGFDPRTLHRIGYGGGYYDKFLAAQPGTKKLGVCFDSGKLDHIPAEPHDVPLDLIVTEQNIYS